MSSPPLFRRCLVTGAGGYGASHVVRRLSEEACVEAVCATDLSFSSPPPASTPGPGGGKLVFRRLDITDAAAVAALMASFRPDTVFHMAALVPFNLSRAYSRAELLRVNVGGTEAVLAGAAAAGARNFVHCSSTGVTFGGASIAGGDESLPLPRAHNDAYSESKALAEGSVLARSSASWGAPPHSSSAPASPPAAPMACVALRPNGIWGPGEAHHIPKVFAAAQAGLSAVVAAPHALTDFTHRDNLAAAFIAAARTLVRSPAARAAAAGKAFFVTDAYRAHTLEFFSPLLAGLGFPAPFPCALLARGGGGAEEDARIGGGAGALAALVATQQSRAADASSSPSTPLLPQSAQATAGSARAGTGGGKRRQPSRRKSPPPSTGGAGAAVASAAAAAAAAADDDGDESAAKDAAIGAYGGRGDVVIVTADPPWFRTVAPCLLYPAALALEAAACVGSALLCRPLEPFLTRADVRKVVQHNYYDSSAAARVLGYAPVRSAGSGMLELIEFYKREGWSGVVVAPPLSWWVSVIGGMLLTFLLAIDAFGCLSAALRAVASTNASVAQTLCTASNAFESGVPWIFSDAVAPPPAGQRPPAFAAANALIAYIFGAAMIAHGAQGLWAFRFAWARRLAAMRWALQCAVLGHPSTSRLVAVGRGGWSACAVASACIGSFLFSIPVAAAIHAALCAIAPATFAYAPGCV